MPRDSPSLAPAVRVEPTALARLATIESRDSLRLATAAYRVACAYLRTKQWMSNVQELALRRCDVAAQARPFICNKVQSKLNHV
ncbi:hypothetical protein V5799_023083 [Amblyomma americanum]|uniref:Uncharacterized protein n=1 Tax=Amblyomma americanum TaxID=6943 RepID=A0AAQ4FJ11_AMBAM